MEPVIEIRGLTARAGASGLLNGVDLTVMPGEVTALVGPSGSGKTTVALALLGESAPGVRLTGSVQVVGTEVVSADGPVPDASGVRGRLVSYMPQHPAHALNPARRTGSVLTELARLHRPDADRRSTAVKYAAQALRTAGLADDRATLRRFPHQFSGGQRQRVALAQVLACGPRVVVLDEPSTGLDTVARMRLAGELTRLTDEGITVLLLSHDHEFVRAVATRTVLLDRGRVTAAGLTADLLPARLLPAPPPRQGGPSPAGRTALQVEGLSAWLRPGRRDQVLHDVTVRVPEGGCTAVVGPSGSGKTVLARCLAGLHERRTGHLSLFGDPLPVLRHRTRRQVRSVQYVWQEVRNSFDERRTVLDQVARTAVLLHGLSPREAGRRAMLLWERLGLTSEQATRHAGSLSGGELQRAALARALLAEPDVLICDEITTALDAVSTGLVTSEIIRIRQESGTAVLWISHDLRLVEQLAEDLVVLDAGTVVEYGARDAVLAAPGARTTRLLLSARHLGVGSADPSAPHLVHGREQPHS
ncbi:ATP-binding cassette domain-containing protein [Streptomyces sp. NPDC048565]|uniref:ABC transporter ATP-binding protein n=1 Tax=Streptomyces sp. NPDC048565 TaxID=3155266 RepID=UPI00344ACC9C